jgi:hypothetical protein
MTFNRGTGSFAAGLGALPAVWFAVTGRTPFAGALAAAAIAGELAMVPFLSSLCPDALLLNAGSEF